MGGAITCVWAGQSHARGCVGALRYTALANTRCDVFTWDTFEKTVRAMTVEATLRMCNVQLESPFITLAIDVRLRKVIECTMQMALAEQNGENSRDAALQLAALMGQRLGLGTPLVFVADVSERTWKGCALRMWRRGEVTFCDMCIWIVRPF